MFTIDGEDEANLAHPLFNFDERDEDLLYIPPKSDKVRTNSARARANPQPKDIIKGVQNGSGSNCFAVHGNYT